jgi:hypothetical protein
MKLDIPSIINKHSNKSALICGLGPSLQLYQDKLEHIKKENVIFACGEFYRFYKVIPDYWVQANNVTTVCNHINLIKNWIGCTIIYADTVELTDKKWIDENLKNDYIPYDQRHFNGMTCNELINSPLKNKGGYTYNGRCCNHIIKGRLTVQEELQKISNYHKFYSTGSTVALHAVAFAVIMGCNPIYITGVDLDYNLGYAKNDSNLQHGPVGELNNYTVENVKDFEIINESAKKLNIKIYNLNPNSSFNVFEKGILNV